MFKTELPYSCPFLNVCWCGPVRFKFMLFASQAIDWNTGCWLVAFIWCAISWLLVQIDEQDETHAAFRFMVTYCYHFWNESSRSLPFKLYHLLSYNSGTTCPIVTIFGVFLETEQWRIIKLSFVWHICTCARAHMQLFRISEMAGPIVLKFGVWSRTH